jgi:hypothetical protein
MVPDVINISLKPCLFLLSPGIFIMKQNVYYNDILLKPLNKNEPLAIQLRTFFVYHVQVIQV